MFVIEGLENTEDALAFARRLYREVRVSVGNKDVSILVTLSIGGCLFPNENMDIRTILKEADMALYRAKANPQEPISFYSAPPIGSGHDMVPEI